MLVLLDAERLGSFGKDADAETTYPLSYEGSDGLDRIKN